MEQVLHAEEELLHEGRVDVDQVWEVLQETEDRPAQDKVMSYFIARAVNGPSRCLYVCMYLLYLMSLPAGDAGTVQEDLLQPGGQEALVPAHCLHHAQVRHMLREAEGGGIVDKDISLSELYDSTHSSYASAILEAW